MRMHGKFPDFFLFNKIKKIYQYNFFFKSGQIYMKDAECAESEEKSNFRFPFFELWSFLTVNFR